MRFSKHRRERSIARVSITNASTILLALAAGCSAGGGDGGGDPAFVVKSTGFAVAGSTPIVVSGKKLAYLAEESATGTGSGKHLNSDNDFADSVAIVLDMGSGKETNLHIAAQAIAWIGDDLYLVVDEAGDGKSWNALINDQIVLLHWSPDQPTPVFIDTLDESSAKKLVTVGHNLFYVSATLPTVAMESNLRVISSSTPLVATPIPTDDLLNPLRVQIVGQDEGLLFLAMDEAAQDDGAGRDLNEDADATPDDHFVLALCDGSFANGLIRNAELALPGVNAPIRAKKIASHDWQVGFFVSEAAQGATNFNVVSVASGLSLGWEASQCNNDDSDTEDDVLFFLEFANWDANRLNNPPRNTGLVAKDKIVIANGFIGTISNEEDAECDLNDDGDTDDDVARWTKIVGFPTQVLPLNNASNIHALFDVPGGTHGLAELENRFVIVASEADDGNIDSEAANHNLVGWLSPQSSAAAWDFTHGTQNSSFVGASFVSEQRDRQHLGVGFEEDVDNPDGQSINGGDDDVDDAFATFADFTGSPARITFPGSAVAIDANNGGIVIINGIGFYRVSEESDDRDWNDDGDEDDFVLFRFSLQEHTQFFMGTLNSLSRPAIIVDVEDSTPYGGAFIADETQLGASGTDLNDDGDKTDLVVRYFKF